MAGDGKAACRGRIAYPATLSTTPTASAKFVQTSGLSWSKPTSQVSDRNVRLVKGLVVFEGATQSLLAAPELLRQHLGVSALSSRHLDKTRVLSNEYGRKSLYF